MNWLLTVDDTGVENQRDSAKDMERPLEPTGQHNLAPLAPEATETTGKRLPKHRWRCAGKTAMYLKILDIFFLIFFAPCPGIADPDLLEQDARHNEQHDFNKQVPGRFAELRRNREETLSWSASRPDRRDETKASPCSRNPKLPTPLHEDIHKGPSMLVESNTEKPYERQKRRKTRHDRYILKDHPEDRKKRKREREKPKEKEAKSSNRQLASSRRRPTIQDAFHAQNVNQGRLTVSLRLPLRMYVSLCLTPHAFS